MTTILVGRDQAYLNHPWVQRPHHPGRTPPTSASSTSTCPTRDKAALYDDGFIAARDFLTTWDWPGYVTRFR